MTLIAAATWASTRAEAAAGPVSDSIPRDLAGLYKARPRLVENLFSRIDLDYPGLDSVRRLVARKRWVAASGALVAYYRRRSATHGPEPRERSETPSPARLHMAGQVLEDVFTFQEVTGRQLTRPDGHLNWTYKGPRNDVEWAYFLNRQGYFNDLVAAYRSTGDARYARKLNSLVSDWVLSNPRPPEKSSIPTWRELEVGLRLTSGNWPRTFYGALAAGALTPVSAMLMLSSVWEQADYLLQYHRMHSNWAAMELNGMGAAAVYWPEFRDAKGWFSHATDKMLEEQAFEVYPGGVQNELTSHYHEVAMNNFAQFRDLAQKSGRQLPEAFSSTLEKMYGYLAWTLRPNGYGLLNNDADLDYNRPLVARAAQTYHREDWTYIVTGGAEGTPPAATSVFYPWAGQMIMRDGWGPEAQWAFFDVGPWGHAHQHNDKLHLSVAAFGHDWLVDGGRYYYKWDEWRRYFVSSLAHNVVLVDGKGQIPTAPIAAAPISRGFATTGGLDFCMGTYGDGFSADVRAKPGDSGVIHATQTRAVVYVKGKYWVVFDHLSAVNGHTLEPLWHFAPGLKVSVSEGVVTAKDSAGASLRVIPSAPALWGTAVVKGAEPPRIQGWYSPTYNEKVANDCIRYRMTASDTAATFAWVIYPAKQGLPPVHITRLQAPAGAARLRIAAAGLPPAEVAVRFYGSGAVPVAGGLALEGDCYFREAGKAPVVVGGRLVDGSGHAVSGR